MMATQAHVRRTALSLPETVEARDVFAFYRQVDRSLRSSAVRNSIMMAAILMLLGCTEASAPEETTTVIRFQGTVRSAAGQAPINQAEIILQWWAGAFGTGTHWAYTDVDGRYNLERDFGGHLFGCDFGIAVQATGYRPQFVQPEQIRCVPEVQTFDFALEPE